MKTLALVALVSAFAIGSMTAPASAQDYATCQAKAVSATTGKPLFGASRTSSINRCMRDTCNAKAAQTVDKNGKKLAGKKKNSFISKCLKGG